MTSIDLLCSWLQPAATSTLIHKINCFMRGTIPRSNFRRDLTITIPTRSRSRSPSRSRYPQPAPGGDQTMRFPHHRLDAYHAAARFLVLADRIASALPRGRAYLVDQLRRASLSIQANIAEGAGEFSPADKARFYRMALRSA